jgi:hypothetical protein
MIGKVVLKELALRNSKACTRHRRMQAFGVVGSDLPLEATVL